MAWFVVGRLFFVAVVAYAAAILQPLSVGLPANIGFGLALAALVVLFEGRLRETAVTRVFGALIGCAIGLGIAQGTRVDGAKAASPADTRYAQDDQVRERS